MANKLTENQIELSNGRVYCICPIKVKYMLTGFYGQYINVKENGFVKLMGCGDGPQIATDFLIASFDSEEIATEVLPELLAKDMTRILEITKRLKELKDNFEIKNNQPPIQE